MNSINQNNEKIKRYLPHELKTRENAVKTYRNGNSISYVENIIFLELLFIVVISNMMVLKNH